MKEREHGKVDDVDDESAPADAEVRRYPHVGHVDRDKTADHRNHRIGVQPDVAEGHVNILIHGEGA